MGTGLVPPVPAVDAGDDEEDLPAGLAEQRLLGVLLEGRGDEHAEEQDVADDADRPRPDPAAQAADGGGEPEGVAEDLAPGDRVPGDGHLRVVEPLEEVHRATASRSSSCRATYLPITSTSRFTAWPGCRNPSVVRRSVSGIRLTVKPS